MPAGLQVTCSRGVKLVADKAIADCAAEDWDLIVCPGGCVRCCCVLWLCVKCVCVCVCVFCACAKRRDNPHRTIIMLSQQQCSSSSPSPFIACRLPGADHLRDDATLTQMLKKQVRAEGEETSAPCTLRCSLGCRRACAWQCVCCTTWQAGVARPTRASAISSPTNTIHTRINTAGRVGQALRGHLRGAGAGAADARPAGRQARHLLPRRALHWCVRACVRGGGRVVCACVCGLWGWGFGAWG